MPPVQCLITIYVNYALPSRCKTLYVNYTMLSCCKGIIYVNYAKSCCLANCHLCELYHAILFCYILHLSTMLLHSTALRVHQPFDTVMANSGVKTRFLEQTMLSDEAHISLVTDSSSEEDSETDDQSYSPPLPRCML